MQKVRLRPDRDYPIRRGHMWIFSGALAEAYSAIPEGEPVDVITSTGAQVGVGYWCGSSIAVKMLREGHGDLDAEFWRQKLGSARKLRDDLGLTRGEDTGCYRLVHAEGDRLPGLIIDIYGSTAVIQYHSLGMALQEDGIVGALRELYGAKLKAAYRKSTDTISTEKPSRRPDGYIFGEQETPAAVSEGGYKFLVDWTAGQKTGFFIDQRDNRARVARYCTGKNVLNAFCYTGAFSVYALGAGAKHVVSVDSSKTALEMAARNVELNPAAGSHETRAIDFQSYIKDAAQFDLIILDPPAFAKNKRSLENAREGYAKINRSALEKLSTGGTLVTFSCSQLMSRDDFLACIREAAFQAGKPLRCVEQLHQAGCHPVNIFHPEVEYLKGFIFSVG